MNMKKNISINISGMIFYIEEDCYEELKAYLNAVNKYFSKYEDSREILEDIESRVAEIFFAKLTKEKQIIVQEDVKDLIATLGSIDDFQQAEQDPAFHTTYEELELPTEDDFLGGNTAVQVSRRKVIPQESLVGEGEDEPHNEEFESEEAEKIYAEATHDYQRQERKSKKLYRDTQRKVLGGVAAGLAHYINIDPIWVRLFFIFLLSGLLFIPAAPQTAIVIYVMLWLVVPKNDHLVENPHIKKLFRDPERAVFGGVSAGLASYLGVNEMYIRIAFIAITLAYGSGLFIYGILWLIIPEAKTLTERMQMEGQPINLSTIRDSIRENISFENAKAELSTVHKIILFPFHIIAMIFQKLANLLRPFVSFAAEAIRIGGGLTLILVSTAMTAALVASIFVILGWGWENAIHIDNIPAEVIRNSFDISGWLIANLYLSAFIPTFLLGLFGVMMLRRNTIWSPKYGWSLLGLWFISLIGSGVTIAMIVNDFNNHSVFVVEEQFSVKNTRSNPFLLDMADRGDFRRARITLKGGYEGEDIKVIKNFQSDGRNEVEATKNAQMIAYQIEQQGNHLIFDRRSSFLPDAKYRNQKIAIELFLPYEAPFKVSDDLILRGNPFQQIHFYGSPSEHTWQFTQEGLTCLDCEESDFEFGEEYYEGEDDEYYEGEGQAIYDGQNIGPFDRIEVGGAFKVKIRQGNKHHVELLGSDEAIESVRLDRSGSTLEIGHKRGLDFSQQGGITAIITMPELESLEIGGACHAELIDFKAPQHEMQIEMGGASYLRMEGQVRELNLDLSGASQLHAFEMEAKDVRIDASGASQARVRAYHDLRIEASGASRVRYSGQPENLSTNTSGGSSVSRD